MKTLMLNPLHLTYGIEQKHGNLKGIYTAKLNSYLIEYFNYERIISRGYEIV